MNLATIQSSTGVADLKRAILEQGVLGTGGVPAPDLLNKLKTIVVQLNRGEPNISIPFASAVESAPMTEILTILNDIKTSNSDSLSREVKVARDDYLREVDVSEIPFADGPVMTLGRRAQLTPEQLRAARIAAIEGRNSMDVAPIPGAPGASLGALQTKINTPGYGRGGRSKVSRAKAGLSKTTTLKDKQDVIDVMGQMLDQTEYDIFTGKMSKPRLKKELKAAGIPFTGQDSKAQLKAKLMAQFTE
jgi:hypothetical protein